MLASETEKNTTTSDPPTDYLEVDTPIPGQNFVCLSFVSPENILAQKEEFFREQFWTYLKQNSSNDRFDLSILDNVSDVYHTFLHERSTELDAEFHKRHDFQTTIRGLKVRGIYSTMDEATIRSKVLQRIDKHHHVFVAPVGYWLPWDPNPDQIEKQEYQEEQLNELMKNYKENEVKRDIYYEKEKSDLKAKAIEENLQRKQAIVDAEATEVTEATDATDATDAAEGTTAPFDEDGVLICFFFYKLKTW
jgi:hypothetical protein